MILLDAVRVQVHLCCKQSIFLHFFLELSSFYKLTSVKALNFLHNTPKKAASWVVSVNIGLLQALDVHIILCSKKTTQALFESPLTSFYIILPYLAQTSSVTSYVQKNSYSSMYAGSQASMSGICHNYRDHNRGEVRSKATCSTLHSCTWENSQPRICNS